MLCHYSGLGIPEQSQLPTNLIICTHGSLALVQTLVPLLYMAFVTAAGCFVAGLVALSTLAIHELRHVLSDTLAQVGMAISR